MSNLEKIELFMKNKIYDFIKHKSQNCVINLKKINLSDIHFIKS
jgi:hypothetical protein